MSILIKKIIVFTINLIDKKATISLIKILKSKKSPQLYINDTYLLNEYAEPVSCFLFCLPPIKRADSTWLLCVCASSFAGFEIQIFESFPRRDIKKQYTQDSTSRKVPTVMNEVDSKLHGSRATGKFRQCVKCPQMLVVRPRVFIGKPIASAKQCGRCGEDNFFCDCTDRRDP